jgi:hypothetical protein
MHTFQVGKHYLPVEDVLMFAASVFDHSVRDRSLVLANELSSATRTLLSELHSGEVYERNASRLKEGAGARQSGRSGAGRRAPDPAVWGTSSSRLCDRNVDSLFGRHRDVVDLLEGDEELGRVVRHPAPMGRPSKTVGSL